MTPIVLVGARLLLGDELVEDLAVVLEGARIAAVLPASEAPCDAAVRALDGGILAPGFIDVQVNGGGGALFNQAPTVESLVTIGEAHRRYGTTGFLPTIITDDIAVIDRAMRAVEQAIDRGVPGVLGIHVEGPMLAAARHGIHDPRHLRGAAVDLLDLLCSLRVGRTLVTLAPEVVAPPAIRRLVEAGVIVAAGHTEATYEQMREGFAAGVTGVTHLFNAMSPMANRAPGAVGASLDDQAVWCGLIVDGVHVHPATLRVALRSRPLDRFMLVTDAMTPVGTNLTAFALQGRRITVAGDRCVDAAGTLAGSVLSMDAAVRNAVGLLGVALPAALRLASTSPAAFLGMASLRGGIAAGMTADLAWLGDELDIRATWIAGREWEGNRA